MSQMLTIIRPMTETDVPSIIEIDREIHYSSWTEEWFYRALKEPYRAYVVEQDRQILGFAVMRYIADEGELLNIGMAKNQQHQGYGKQLFLYLIKTAQQKNIRHIFLEVRASNATARRLYEQCGFQPIDVRKAYYQLPQVEEAIVYQLNL